MSKVRVVFSENNITFDGTAPETYAQGLPSALDSSDMTLSMWINPTSPYGSYSDMCLMSLGYNSYSDNYFNWKLSYYQILQYSESSMTADYSSYLGWMADYSNSGGIAWNVPTHVAMVKRGNTGMFYINGQLSYTYTPSKAAPGLNITNQDFVIGGCPSEYGWAVNANNFVGQMDTIRMFQGAMEKWQLAWLADPSLYVHDSNDLAMLDTRFVAVSNSLLGRRKTTAATIAKLVAARAVVDPNEQVIVEGDTDIDIKNGRSDGNPSAVFQRPQRGLQTANTVEVPFTLSYVGVSSAPDAIASYVSSPTFSSSFAASFAQFMQYSSTVVGVNVASITVFPVANVAVPSSMPTQQPIATPPPPLPPPYENICGALGASQNCSEYNYVVDTVAGSVPSSVFIPYYPAYNDDYYYVKKHQAGYTTTASHPGSTGAMVIIGYSHIHTLTLTEQNIRASNPAYTLP